jgi:pimeloyl-ACP methyl ester carboxylesterase
VNNNAKLAAAHTAVNGAAADGVTQLLLQIPASNPGDSFTVQVLNENNQADTTAAVGGLFAIGDVPGNAANSLNVTAESPGPMAFATYITPTNFVRQGNQQDASAIQRTITFQVSCTSGSSQASTASYLMRPPVVLIHGLWSRGNETWSGFIPQVQVNQNLWNDIDPQEVNYFDYVTVNATYPSYPNLTQVRESALGFSYNAPGVLEQVNDFIHQYGVEQSAAVVQADVVAHSMGGDIARTMPSVTYPSFLWQNNYNLGPIHKLITIGTPHLGTQLATDLLPGPAGDLNSCVRNALAGNTLVSLLSATLATGVTVDGAVGDLQATSLPSGSFPIAYIAGSTIPAINLFNLDARLLSASGYIYTWCGVVGGSPLAQLLTNTPSGTWNREFNLLANDGIVPVISQTNSCSSELIFPGTIHSQGIEKLDFTGPSELDSASGIPDEVINLLNEQITGPDFFPGGGCGGGGGGGPSS